MEDRDGKRTFTIPKTRTSNKDVLIPEKADSRNVTELFDDIKSCALETHFDFRQNECKSCETIRNQKLQKLYNDKKVQMKKTHDSIERFAFHLITSRDMAINIANDGLQCEQLSFSIDKYLGNPKDGIHLSRRPDVLLASSSMQGLYKFGILICKVSLGKGYTTIPSVNNKQFSAQLHYDHHFCKIQSSNKEQRQIDDLLANSLIFCYEHDDLAPVSRPSQILPVAILWYELKEKFSPYLTSKSQQSQKHNENKVHLKNINKIKAPARSLSKPLPLLNTGTWDDLTPDTKVCADIKTPSATQTVTNKYPSQLMLPLSSFSNLQQLANYRDPRLIRSVASSEAIPLSPQNPIQDKFQNDASTTKPSILAKKSFLTTIPLNSTTSLTDPRAQIDKSKRKVFYLELQAVKHAIQQQKRLNNYHNSKNNTKPKTSYTLIPFLVRSISSDEYESNNKTSNHSSLADYSQLCVSVVDCYHFGLKPQNNKLYIDLEEYENQVAYKQVHISNNLIEQEKKLNSKEVHLRLREKRQRKRQEYLDQQKKYYSTNSKHYVIAGRKLLKENQTVASSSNHKLSSELLDFFSHEYRTEQRSNVKRLLAELLGVLVEKYALENQLITSNNIQDEIFKDSTSIEDKTMNDVIDMDLGSPSSQGLCDYDERFRSQTPPSTVNKSIHNRLATFVSLTQPLSIEKNNILDELNNNTIEHIQPLQIDLSSSSLSNDVVNNVCFKPKTETIDFSYNENHIVQSNPPLSNNDNLQRFVNSNSLTNIDDDSNSSRDEFVKLLTKEVYTTKSPSPSKSFDQHRTSYDNDEVNFDRNSSSTRTVTIVSNNYQDNLIIETKSVNEEQSQEQPTVKRIKITPIHDLDTSVNIIDDHDYRKDLDERKRQMQKIKKIHILVHVQNQRVLVLHR